MDYQQILKDIYQEIQPYASIGKQADYIPALAKINPDQFGMCIHTIKTKLSCMEKPPPAFPSKVFRKFFTCHVFESWRR